MSKGVKKISGYLYLGFVVSLDEYIDNEIVIDKGKKTIIDMLELV